MLVRRLAERSAFTQRLAAIRYSHVRIDERPSTRIRLSIPDVLLPGRIRTVSEIVVYTRPGCPFCFKLRLKLRLRRLPFREVDIWQDTAAAEAVRAAAGGNETVPTVNIGERWLVNPSLREVISAATADGRQSR